ncbi:MAG: hypothetical protein COB16_15515 [Rhodobacteraceae bacterium]|nr:MAG: hypothetical protein COB16_15515 [Paracoccaceae bacterium]
MTGNTSFHDKYLRIRLERLMSGDVRVEDVAQLYIGKRFKSYGRTGFREIADFAAHPDERSRGPVTDRIRDMHVTFKPLLDKSLKKEGSSLEDIIARSESNFRMASDDQIAILSNGRKRQQVGRNLRSAVVKMQAGKFHALTAKEQEVAISFGDRLIWNPVLRAQEVFDDFKFVLIKNGLLEAGESDRLESARSVIVLHAIATMHGTKISSGPDLTGELQAGFDNSEGVLEVTACLQLEGYPKKVTLKVGLYLTDLMARDHVSPALNDHPGPWAFPIEISEGQIMPIGEIVPIDEPPEATAVVEIK